jgi:hypothetical protein
MINKLDESIAGSVDESMCGVTDSTVNISLRR